MTPHKFSATKGAGLTDPRHYLYRAEQMRRVDAATAQKGLPTLLLMERAGQAVAKVLLAQKLAQAVVLCGPGNNGGDGYVVARYLVEAGAGVEVLELHSTPKTTDATVMRQAWQASTPDPISLLNITTLNAALAHDHDSLWVVDALLGSGLTRPVVGELATVIQRLNMRPRPWSVLSIDVPSGLRTDSATLPPNAVQADVTVQLAAGKIASAFYPAKRAYGQQHCVRIGIPDKAWAVLADDPPSPILLSHAHFERWRPRRERDNHKYQVGTVLVLAGSTRYRGAAALCCAAALRAGAGLVTLFSDGAYADNPEVICELLQWPELIKNLKAIPKKRQQVRIIGPGLPEEAKQQIAPALALHAGPTVLDASALIPDELWLAAVRAHGHCVLTPHQGEAARLLAAFYDETPPTEPLQQAQALAAQTQAMVVLKGPTTIIASPQGETAVSVYGHAGMAVGGTGDVLAGVVGAYLAQNSAQDQDDTQGLKVCFRLVCAAVMCHGLAGEEAATRYDSGLLPSDIITALATV